MNKELFAQMLDGRQYLSEISESEVALAKEHGLVVMFGYSDDNAEFRGAVENGLDELSAWEGTRVSLASRDGKAVLVKDPEEPDCLDSEEVLKQWGYLEHAKDRFKNAAKVEFKWDSEGYSWFVEAQMQYAPFDILEDGEKFCRGIVVSVVDLPADLVPGA